ncbi:MAG: 50S ribosomal protein L23, partial [Thaumarchaeota archaeon S15]
MSPEEASRIVVRPYITEKTFAMVEGEAKICFIVDRGASKSQVAEAIEELYGQKA